MFGLESIIRSKLYDGGSSGGSSSGGSGGGAVSGAGWVPFAQDGATCTGEEVVIPANGSYDLMVPYEPSDNNILLITIGSTLCVAVAEGNNYTIYGHDNLSIKGSNTQKARITTLNEETITCTLKIERYNAT